MTRAMDTGRMAWWRTRISRESTLGRLLLAVGISSALLMTMIALIWISATVPFFDSWLGAPLYLIVYISASYLVFIGVTLLGIEPVGAFYHYLSLVVAWVLWAGIAYALLSYAAVRRHRESADVVGLRLSADVRPIAEVMTDSSAAIEQIRETKRPIILEEQGRGTVVLLSIDVYEDLIKDRAEAGDTDRSE